MAKKKHLANEIHLRSRNSEIGLILMLGAKDLLA